jgi:DNA invertase Pin-like site-specific DNA recombinase
MVYGGGLQLVQRRGYQIVHEYTDRISGTKAKRPALDQLMGDARRIATNLLANRISR